VVRGGGSAAHPVTLVRWLGEILVPGRPAVAHEQLAVPEGTRPPGS
jgi:hypothetical protein